MKTYISDIIPKLQRYSQQLDNLTLLTNQHWVVIDEIANSKNVYIFRSNHELLISKNGKVEKARWEYLGNNSLLIDRKDESYLFKHGFFDGNILALKVDGKAEYAFLINETKYNGELNTLERVINFLTYTYLEPHLKRRLQDATGLLLDTPEIKLESEKVLQVFDTDKGPLAIELINIYSGIGSGDNAFLYGQPAPDGKYKLDFLWYVYIQNGKVTKESML